MYFVDQPADRTRQKRADFFKSALYRSIHRVLSNNNTSYHLTQNHELQSGHRLIKHQ